MKLKNSILIIIGIFSLSLGAVGIFLPVLPTTPFVLLSAGCFSISSPKLADNLMKSKYFGSYIENYRYKTGVPRSVKIRAILFLWTGLLISMLIIRKIMIIGLLILIGSLVTIHLSKLKTREK
jgi:uncharacterized protein